MGGHKSLGTRSHEHLCDKTNPSLLKARICLKQHVAYCRPCSQVTSPVLWENTMSTLFEKGLTKSYEIGPNKVIAGIAKRINKAHDIVNISA